MKHILITTIAAVLLVGTASADPIHDTAGEGDIAAVKQHLATGTDVNAKERDGRTPLDSAIFRNHPETANLLRKHGGKRGRR